MQQADSFFHNHGYANVATLLQGARKPGQASTWLDSLYLKLPGGPLVVPTGLDQPCSAEDQQANRYCGPHARWEQSMAKRWQCPEAHGGAAADADDPRWLRVDR